MDSTATPDEMRRRLGQLAAHAQSGNPAAFEQLIKLLEPGLKRMLLRRTGGQRELAEDLTQRTRIALWQALSARRYDPAKAAVSTFAYAIAYKLWLQHLRRRGTPAEQMSSAAPSVLESDANADELSAALHASELLDALRVCLRATGTRYQLTDEERLIVIGLATGESERSLAARLGIVASTVHSRKLLAYEKLRRCLDAKGFSADESERRPPRGE
jgi:RNA polymerase sigma factor (sigma-70 family)